MLRRVVHLAAWTSSASRVSVSSVACCFDRAQEDGVLERFLVAQLLERPVVSAQTSAGTIMTVVRLYTPLSREAAARALAGEGFPDSVIFFVDSPHHDAAEEDTAWVAVELPESQVERFEDYAEVFRGYRKFTIPGRTAGRLPVFPVDIA